MNETEFEVEFEKVLAEFTQQVRDGDTPSIEEYATRHPDHREQIESLFPVVGCLEKTRREKVIASTASQRRWKFSGKSQLGDYELVREIGRGGMGVVYEARQRSLDRKVALKVLPAEQAMTPSSIARFQREARMAAQLHHSHIVPVLGHGQDDGNHFIAMQLIEGVGLNRIAARLRGDTSADISDADSIETNEAASETISEQPPGDLPSDIHAAQFPFEKSSIYETEIASQIFPDGYGTATFWQRVAEIGIGISNALAHSHEHFILHRDIKPSNLIVDRSGKTWVADFGLARSFEGVTADDMTRETGTPRYMAPEQIVGQTSERSDLYSFGLTLYELVTSQRVFPEPGPGDRANFRARKRQALKPVRKIAPNVPSDLAKIIDKCVQVEPLDRYQNATQLSDDFERVVDCRPLAHVHTPFWTRANRWTQRNPALALAAAVTAFSLLAVAIVISNSFRQQQAELHRTKSALQISVNTLDKVYDRLAPDDLTLLNQFAETEGEAPSRLSNANAQLLGELLESYDQLSHLDGDGSIQVEAAQANYRAGQINRRLGKYSEARSALMRSIELNEGIVRQEPKNPDAKIRIVQCYIALALTDQVIKTEARYRNLEMAVDFAEATLDDASLGLSEEKQQTLKFELAKALYQQSLRPKRNPNQFPGGDSAGRRGPRQGGPPPRRRGGQRNEESAKHLARAIELLQEWRKPRPANVRSLLSICYGETSDKFDDRNSRHAIQIQKALVSEYPDSQIFKANLAALLGKADPLRNKPIEFSTVIAQLQESIRLANSLDMNDTSIRTMIKHNHHKLAILFNLIATKPDRIPPEVLAKFRDDPMSNPIEDAVFHGMTALQLHSSEQRSEPEGRNRHNNHYHAWRLRFQLSLAKSLWNRNRSTDRTRVERMYLDTVKEIGPLSESRRGDRELISMLKQLEQISQRPE